MPASACWRRQWLTPVSIPLARLRRAPTRLRRALVPLPMSSTIADLLEAGAADGTAIGAPGGVPLSYRALRSLVSETIAALRARGLKPNDRIAIVLDNGPEMATAFLSIATGATAAPLNPAYRAEEFEFYLTDLQAKLLVVARDSVSPAIDVAAKL